MNDELEDYDYTLPEQLIARYPSRNRDEARLMLVERQSGRIAHHRIRELPDLLRRGDRLVLNNSKVLPARLLGRRAATGGRWEGLYLESTPSGDWRLLASTRGRIQAGETIAVTPAHSPESGDVLPLTLVDREDDGVCRVRPPEGTDVFTALNSFGTLPLPPYMDRQLAQQVDYERYQTVYAAALGSVAAPTAGLHFTPELLARCDQAGVRHDFVTLHVGIGTFRPISVSRLEEHRMHSEWCEVPPETASQIRQTRESGGRIVAVGTTTTRTLETAARRGTELRFSGPTDIFIRPPYSFQAVDVQLTNFHLPRSSLLVMISAFAGKELIRRAYAEAIRAGYRFYSYGDAMLIV